MNKTIGQAIQMLRMQHGLSKNDLATVMKMNGSTLGKIERNEKELSFLAAVRLLEKFELSMDEFVYLLSIEEVNRRELASIRFIEKMSLRKGKNTIGSPIVDKASV